MKHFIKKVNGVDIYLEDSNGFFECPQIGVREESLSQIEKRVKSHFAAKESFTVPGIKVEYTFPHLILANEEKTHYKHAEMIDGEVRLAGNRNTIYEVDTNDSSIIYFFGLNSGFAERYMEIYDFFNAVSRWLRKVKFDYIPSMPEEVETKFYNLKKKTKQLRAEIKELSQNVSD